MTKALPQANVASYPIPKHVITQEIEIKRSRFIAQSD